METTVLKETGMKLLCDERLRQRKVEGWLRTHDDKHEHGELALAAICYQAAEGPESRVPHDWPFENSEWKPKDRLRNLVRAGALFLAESERLGRAAESVCITCEPVKPLVRHNRVGKGAELLHIANHSAEAVARMIDAELANAVE